MNARAVMPARTPDPVAAIRSRHCPIGRLIGAIFVYISLTHLLLWRMLDFAGVATFAISLVAVAAIGVLAARSALTGITVPLPQLGWCFVLAALLLALGGEGRALYLNYDWQLRDAVLGDLIRQPWPFVYTERGVAEVLRAPLGMYLLPALVGKAAGPAIADVALLIQNAFLLGSLLAVGSALFEERAHRWIGAAVIILFSGMDVLGGFLLGSFAPAELLDFRHLEFWMRDHQFSSHVTQVAWVPQHGLAGWIGAVLLLLWRGGKLSSGPLLASVPLLAFWSPLSALGVLPFAALAGLTDLWRRRLRGGDWALSALAVAFAVPALFYLVAGGESLGFRLKPFSLLGLVLFLYFEVALYLVLAFLLIRRDRVGPGIYAVMLGVLLVTPLFQIGQGVDFTMRVSVPALAVASVLIADAVHAGWRQRAERRPAMLGAALLLALTIGAVTPLMEAGRAFAYRPSPRTACSLIGSWNGFVWEGETFEVPMSKSTYLAPVASLPEFMRPERPARVAHERDPATCWSRPWLVRR